MAGAASKFLGNTVGEGAAFAAGLAIAPTLAPLLRALENETWSAYPDRPIDPGTLATGVAEGHITEAQGAAEAALTGTSAARFHEMVTIARVGPGVASALVLWRRGLLNDQGVTTALERAGLEPEWITAMTSGGIDGLGLKNQPLDPSVIANAIVRGIMDAPFELPVPPPTEVGKVPAFPTSPIDTKTEAAASGVDLDRLFVQTAIAGRPMAPEEAAKSTFRGILERADFDRAISEGDVRNEWADSIFEYTRQILTAHDFVELRLRGWIDDPTMYAGTALHGMSQSDTDLLFRVLGRPIPVHQITTGEARGGSYNGDTSQIPDAYLRSLEESNQRPEWYSLSYANRYTLPSAFVLKALATAGDLSQSDTETLLLQIGWPPDLAAKVSKVWIPTTAAPPKPKKLTNATIRSLYRKGELVPGDTAANLADAIAKLAANGLSEADAKLYLEA